MPERPLSKEPPAACLVVVDLYDGAYGPTLRLGVQSTSALTLIRDMLKALAGGAAEVVIENGPHFHVTGLDKLRLLLQEQAAHGKHLVRGGAGGRLEYRWVMDRDGWRTRVGLVGGLLQHGPPGHQYLSDEGVDDVLVEVVFGERPATRSTLRT